jgi:hypothetical protein
MRPRRSMDHNPELVRTKASKSPQAKSSKHPTLLSRRSTNDGNAPPSRRRRRPPRRSANARTTTSSESPHRLLPSTLPRRPTNHGGVVSAVRTPRVEPSPKVPFHRSSEARTSAVGDRTDVDASVAQNRGPLLPRRTASGRRRERIERRRCHDVFHGRRPRRTGPTRTGCAPAIQSEHRCRHRGGSPPTRCTAYAAHVCVYVSGALRPRDP